jgi:Bacterial PH domain
VTDDAAPAQISAVPRRMRLLCAAVAVVVIGVMAYVAVTLPSTTNTVIAYGTADQFAMLGIGVVLAAGIAFLGRSRVDADAAGIRFRNIAMQHRLPWSAVRAVAFDRRSAWATLVLENDDEVALLAIQAVDGERAVAAVEGLRALRTAARAKDPKPPPLLY